MIKKIAGTLLNKGLIVAANFLLVILSSRFLGSAGRGAVNLFATDFTIILLFSGIISGSAMAFFSARKPAGTICLIAYVWSFFISLAGTVVMQILHPGNHGPALFAVAFLQSANTIHQMLLLGNGKLSAYNLNTVIQPVLTIGFSAATFFFHAEKSVEVIINSYALGSLAAYITGILQSLSFFRNTTITGVYSTSREMFIYGTGTYISTIVQMINYKISYYVLFWLGFSNAIGVLSNGAALTEATWLICNSLSLVLYSKVLADKDGKEHVRETLQLTQACFILTGIALLIICAVPAFVFTFLFGKDFSGIRTTIYILSPGVLLIATSTVIAHYYSAQGNFRVNNIKSLIGLVVAIVSLFLLVPQWGITGAAFATSISYSAGSIYLIYYFISNSSIPPTDLFRIDATPALEKIFRKTI